MSEGRAAVPEYKRKAMRLGQSTIIVSLPKEWVNSMGIKPGTSLRIWIEEDGSLKVLPGELGEEYSKKLKICVVNVEEFKDPSMLESIIVGAYVVGWPNVKIVSKKGELDREVQKTIFNTINMLEGAIISDQTRESTMIQFITDLTNLNFYSVLKRMYTMLISMLERVSYEIEYGSYKFNELEAIENAMDKSYRVALRQIILAQKIPRILESIGVESRLHLLGNRAIIKAIEESADALYETFNKVDIDGVKEALTSKTIKLGLLTTIREISELVSRMYTAMDVMDEKKAHEIIKERRSIIDKIGDLRRELLEKVKNVKAAVSLWEILNSLEKILDYMKGIAEIIINRSIEECEKRWS